MKRHPILQFRSLRKPIAATITGLVLFFSSFAAPVNDLCTAPTNIVINAAAINGTLTAATTDNVPTSCGAVNAQDVWYTFTPTTAYPVITVSNLGGSWGVLFRMQVLIGTCGSFTEKVCTNATTVDTRVTPGGAGLIPGQLYYIRIHKSSNSAVGAATWTFKIAVTEKTAGTYDFGKSYVNITKGTSGGTINPNDVLEIRATFVVKNTVAYSAADSLAFFDTLYHNKGFELLSANGTICAQTNEGKVFGSATLTNAADGDAASATQVPVTLDTAIRLNFGPGATSLKRGRLASNSKPSVFGSTCIIMLTYRVRVYATYNTTIRWGGGKITYRDTMTGVTNNYYFKGDSLVVYNSPGLCPNAVSASNAIGVESNGSFGTPTWTGSALARNKGASASVPGYTYQTFARGQGPGDYFYGITNNTSAEFWRSVAADGLRPKADVDPDAGGPKKQYRVFNEWDIMGDHSGASNPAKGNAPCDTTQPISASNPCGYMLVVNSAYKTDTAFQYSVTNVCPNTYYEISAWVKNICSRCACDSNGVQFIGGYVPTDPSDSSGVAPNLAFEINGYDYYSTGNIKHTGAGVGITPMASDSMNIWHNRGFVYKTGPSENNFVLTIRNNAPGGGGNDWAIDDISVKTCLPNMNYSPSLNPNVCDSNSAVIRDTVRSFFNNYTEYKWQRSTDGGGTWNDVAGTTGSAVPVLNGSVYEYVISYTIPANMAYAVNNGDKYRVVVATTSANLSNANCQVTDGVSIITLNVIHCSPILTVDMLSFNGHLENTTAKLAWTMSRETEKVNYIVERSFDGLNFITAGTISGQNNPSLDINYYNFTDPVTVNGKAWYRIVTVDARNKRKYSRTILLNTDLRKFEVTNVLNPFRNELDFVVNSNDASRISVEMVDLNGKTVKKNNFLTYEGVNSLNILNTGALPSGIYTLKITHNNEIISRQVFKTN